jgi:hypothetical protein
MDRRLLYAPAGAGDQHRPARRAESYRHRHPDGQRCRQAGHRVVVPLTPGSHCPVGIGRTTGRHQTIAEIDRTARFMGIDPWDATAGVDPGGSPDQGPPDPTENRPVGKPVRDRTDFRPPVPAAAARPGHAASPGRPEPSGTEASRRHHPDTDPGHGARGPGQDIRTNGLSGSVR